MSLEVLRNFLLWCTVINYGVLLLWFLVFTLARDWLQRLQVEVQATDGRINWHPFCRPSNQRQRGARSLTPRAVREQRPGPSFRLDKGGTAHEPRSPA